MVGAVGALADPERALVDGAGGVIGPQLVQDATELAEGPGDVRMIGAEDPLANRQRALDQDARRRRVD